MIYIVEDDNDIREMESYAIKNSGFEVQAFSNGKEFFAALEKQLPKLVMLDIMLPGEDGLAILHRIREKELTRGIPVIMVTAKTSEIDKVKGLDMGADDYITKPFGVMELVSRVKALLRRCENKQEVQTIIYKDITIDDHKHKVTVGGETCVLTYKEYELLKYLITNKDIALSREKLLGKVWGYDFEGESRTVDMHIKTLRQKLGEAGNYIVTVRHVGYKIGE
ncbi:MULTISPECIES: response regulator transcription factor [unclassified Ruminococcus]|uniref:response regulator transcription factor n=1 Tax=unclassified Ruminococcus TaxID=2608920 RepID=UPI00210C6A79|nr:MULTISPECIES: response regulator transcription factor [unclassified Ruminococcus]MCQ4021475.1 response regulator [Ruminococcus sp. zg-924]MCQ4113920.1 response regulator [Ruminococcus sp. zg-921]